MSPAHFYPPHYPNNFCIVSVWVYSFWNAALYTNIGGCHHLHYLDHECTKESLSTFLENVWGVAHFYKNVTAFTEVKHSTEETIRKAFKILWWSLWHESNVTKIINRICKNNCVEKRWFIVFKWNLGINIVISFFLNYKPAIFVVHLVKKSIDFTPVHDLILLNYLWPSCGKKK